MQSCVICRASDTILLKTVNCYHLSVTLKLETHSILDTFEANWHTLPFLWFSLNWKKWEWRKSFWEKSFGAKVRKERVIAKTCFIKRLSFWMSKCLKFDHRSKLENLWKAYRWLIAFLWNLNLLISPKAFIIWK